MTTLMAEIHRGPVAHHLMPLPTDEEVVKRTRRLNALCGKRWVVGQIALLFEGKDDDRIKHGSPSGTSGIRFPTFRSSRVTFLHYTVGVVREPIKPLSQGTGWKVPVQKSLRPFDLISQSSVRVWEISSDSLRRKRVELLIGTKEIFEFFDRESLRPWLYYPPWQLSLVACYRIDPKLLCTREVRRRAKPFHAEIQVVQQNATSSAKDMYTEWLTLLKVKA